MTMGEEMFQGQGNIILSLEILLYNACPWKFSVEEMLHHRFFHSSFYLIVLFLKTHFPHIFLSPSDLQILRVRSHSHYFLHILCLHSLLGPWFPTFNAAPLTLQSVSLPSHRIGHPQTMAQTFWCLKLFGHKDLRWENDCNISIWWITSRMWFIYIYNNYYK